MIQRLRKRFIRTAMAAFGAVLLLVLISLNAITRFEAYRDIDRRLVFLAENMIGPTRGMIDITPEMMRSWLEINDAGIMQETSYFIFDEYMRPDVQYHQKELLTAALGQDASGVIRSLLAGTRDFGIIGSYRYYRAARSDPYKLVFLRCDKEFSSMRTLFHSSILVGAGFFLLVFLLVTLLSKKVMRPFEENIENQKRFISNASHELKTPLGVIVSDLDMQVMESGSSEWLENAQLQADHLALLIEQLTSYALLDEKRQRVAPVPVDLSALSEALFSDFRPLAAAGGQTLSCDIAPDVMSAGNEDAFRTLLSVLMENAVKYTPVGGTIDLRVKREKHAILEVENTCGDLSEDRLERLFERFYRAPEHQDGRGGSGLGLSIAQEITTLYGGAISARRGEPDTLIITAELPPAGG